MINQVDLLLLALLGLILISLILLFILLYLLFLRPRKRRGEKPAEEPEPSNRLKV
jgi:heme/copper-type cytochrome/quinol oxidase subunit 2